MKAPLVIELIHNIAILLALSLIYDYFWTQKENKNIFFKVVSGIIIGAGGIILMLTPWSSDPGLSFDTRSVMLSVSGLFFGPVPTIIGMIITGSFRYYQGGSGMWMGLTVIFTSGSVGILWNYFRPNWRKTNNFFELAGLGILVHLIMLACVLLLPSEIQQKTFRQIFFTVLFFYPLASVLLIKLMLNQSANRENKKTLDSLEERWKYALEGAGEGVWDWNVVTNSIYFSPQCKSMLGYENNELGDDYEVWKALIHPEDERRVKEFVVKFLVEKSSVFQIEFRLMSKAGVYKWILDRGKLVEQTKDGEPLRVVGTQTDISDRKEKEILLKNERFLLDSLMDFTPESIYFKDLNSKFIRVNDASAKSMGCNNISEVIGKSDFDFYAEDYATKTFNDEQEIIRTGKYFHAEEMGHTIDGRETWGITNKMPLRDSNGNIVGTFGLSINITERKQKEKLLEHERYLVDSLLKYTPVNIYFKDLDSKFIRVNEAAVRNLGCSDGSQMVGKSDFDFFSEKDATIKYEQEQEIIRSGQPISIEEQDLRKDGKIIWNLTNKLPLYNTEGQITGTFGVSVDITEIKEKELLLEHERYLVDSLLKYSPVNIYFKDLNSKFIRVNDVLVRNLGYTDDSQLIGKSDFDFYSEADATIKFNQEQEIIRSGQPIFMEEHELRKNGKITWGLTNKLPLYNTAGQISGIFGMSVDITEIKEKELLLEHERYLVDSLLKYTPEAIYFKDLDSRFIRVNDAVARSFGCTDTSQVVGKSDFDFYLEETASIAFNQEQEIIRTGIPLSYEERGILKDGTVMWSLTNKMPLRDVNGKIIGTFGISIEITKRKLAEDALKESQALYFSFIEQLPNPVFRKDLEGRYVLVNSQFCELKGLTEESIIGKTPEEILKTPDVARKNPKNKSSFEDVGEERHKVILQTGESFYDQEVYITPDDDELYMDVVRMPVVDHVGNIVGSQGIMFDVTERQKAEEALKMSEKGYRELIDGMAETVCVFDLDGNLIDVNKTAVDILGYSKEELLDSGLFVFDPSIVKGETKRKVSSDKIEIIESTHRTKDGQIIPVEVYSSLVTYQGKQVVLSIARDITERLQAEQKVRESEKKLSTLFESMTEMVLMCELVYNQQGDVVNYLLYDCNQSFTRMTGIKKEDVVGKMASEVFSSQIQFRFEEYAKVALYGEPYSYADYFESLSKHVLISVVSPKVNHFAAIIADITEIKESQELLAEKNKELENYIYVASHDLRSPLVNIQGFTNRLKKQSDAIKAILDTCQFDAEAKSQLDKITNESIPKTQNFILTNVTKMDKLINGLLQLSRTGRIKMTINKVDTNKLFAEILATYNYQLADLSANVKLDHLPDCYGDVNQLNQLFSNIIGNAIKYRDPDRELELEISGQRRLDKVIYSIKDNGIGIAQKYLERIWDVFYRVNPVSQEAGDGIGLSLVKRITEKHKGKIHVESEVDKGTTFYIELQSNEFSE